MTAAGAITISPTSRAPSSSDFLPPECPCETLNRLKTSKSVVKNHGHRLSSRPEMGLEDVDDEIIERCPSGLGPRGPIGGGPLAAALAVPRGEGSIPSTDFHFQSTADTVFKKALIEVTQGSKRDGKGPAPMHQGLSLPTT